MLCVFGNFSVPRIPWYLLLFVLYVNVLICENSGKIGEKAEKQNKPGPRRDLGAPCNK